MENTIYIGDALEVLKTLPDESVQTCITSPPYFGLRDYGTGQWLGGNDECSHEGEAMRTCANINRNTGSGTDQKNAQKLSFFKEKCGLCGAVREDKQIGLEASVGEYLERLVDVFDQVHRVLKDDGTLWVNMGDSYNSHAGQNSGKDGYKDGRANRTKRIGANFVSGFKAKDLMGMPWRLAFALHDAGWYLRQDIIWHKLNPMPESVTDRCTKAHEYIFLLAKKERYYYNADAIREPLKEKTFTTYGTIRQPLGNDTLGLVKADNYSRTVPERKPKLDEDGNILGANKRTVWPIAGSRYKEAHFATFPPSLIVPCVLAGTKTGDTVLDPFSGAGTTGLVALGHGRRYVGIELNPDYAHMSKRRIESHAPMFNTISIAV